MLAWIGAAVGALVLIPTLIAAWPAFAEFFTYLGVLFGG